MFVFKSWRETIANAEHVHQEEDVKLRLNTEHFPSYYMNETILQAGKEKIFFSFGNVSNNFLFLAHETNCSFYCFIDDILSKAKINILSRLDDMKL